MDKASVRAQFLKRRQVLTPDEVQQGSEKIAERLRRLLAPKPLHYLHIFLPQRERNEIDTIRMGEIVRADFPDVQLVVPRVVPGTSTLEHYLYTPQTPLIPNRWGIPEPDPQQAQPVAPDLLDAVLVPLLAFDRQGYRVGYGGGYYDRFLPQCHDDTLKIGLSFFEPVDTIDDIHAYDVRLDYCLTPYETWRWRGRA